MDPTLPSLLSLSFLLPFLHAERQEAAGLGVIASQDELTLVLLETGEDRTPRSPEEAQQMQQGHIENLTRLGEEGKSLVAGPLGRESKKIRGIVVLHRVEKLELDRCFAPDPYIQHDVLRAHAIPLRRTVGALKHPVLPFTLASHAIALFRSADAGDGVVGKETGEKSAEEGAVDRAAMEALLEDLAGPESERGPVGFAGVLEGDDRDWCGVALLRGGDLEAARSALQDLDDIRSGLFTVELHALAIAQGCLEAEARPASPKDGGE